MVESIIHELSIYNVNGFVVTVHRLARSAGGTNAAGLVRNANSAWTALGPGRGRYAPDHRCLLVRRDPVCDSMKETARYGAHQGGVVS